MKTPFKVTMTKALVRQSEHKRKNHMHCQVFIYLGVQMARENIV